MRNPLQRAVGGGKQHGACIEWTFEAKLKYGPGIVSIRE